MIQKNQTAIVKTNNYKGLGVKNKKFKYAVGRF